MSAFPWLLSVVLFFVAVRHVITWAWLPWILCIGLVFALGTVMAALGNMFRR